MREFDSERTIIRPFVETDFEDLKALMTDPDVMKYTGFQKPQSEEKIRSCLENWMSDVSFEYGVWCIEEKSTGDFLGWFMLRFIDYESPELGYMLSKSKWGQGFATEVSKRFIEFSFNELKIDKVVALTDKRNTPSIRILEKIGMTQKLDFRRSDGNEHAIFFEICKSKN